MTTKYDLTTRNALTQKPNLETVLLMSWRNNITTHEKSTSKVVPTVITKKVKKDWETLALIHSEKNIMASGEQFVIRMTNGI